MKPWLAARVMRVARGAKYFMVAEVVLVERREKKRRNNRYKGPDRNAKGMGVKLQIKKRMKVSKSMNEAVKANEW